MGGWIMDATINHQALLEASRKTETAWRDIKAALDIIEEGEDDHLLRQWVVIGERLMELRKRYPSFRGDFRQACINHGIYLHGKLLTSNEISAAQWWAALAPEQRDTLRAEFPDRLTPENLQKGCREKHPEWAKTGKSVVSGSSGSGQKRRGRPKKAAVEQRDDEAEAEPEPQVKLTAADKKRLKAELEQEEKERLREHHRGRRSARAERTRAIDDTSKSYLQPHPTIPVVMYGKKLWPVTAEERLETGHYDYDQLVFAIQQFTSWSKFAPENGIPLSVESRATHLRMRVFPLSRYVRHCLPAGECKAKLEAFIAIYQKLADFYLANPNGECQPPHHGNIPT
jgi:hypothetical protein